MSHTGRKLSPPHRACEVASPQRCVIALHGWGGIVVKTADVPRGEHPLRPGPPTGNPPGHRRPSISATNPLQEADHDRLTAMGLTVGNPEMA
jgi:hypothetical protein